MDNYFPNNLTNIMARKIVQCFLLLSVINQTILASNPTDSTTLKPTSLVKAIKTKSFKELDELLNAKTLDYQSQESEFNQDYIAQNFVLDSTTNAQKLEAKAVMDELERTQNYINLISPNDLITLPVGVKQDIGNVTYIMGISEARITPEYMEVTAFVRIIIPQKDDNNSKRELFFGANNIKLSHKGGIYGDANLVLLGDIPIPINGGNAMLVLKGGFDMQTSVVADLTYVTINCGGFKELGLAADVLFPRSMLEPVDANYSVISDKNEKVKGSFQTIVSDWNDILVEISLPRFQLTKSGNSDGSGKGGLIFELNTAVFDFSDIRNSPAVNFPPDYQQYLVSGNEQLWRGVYVQTLSVILPPQFKKRNNKERIFFEATNLLIDGMGVSGNFSVDNILPITEGDASKWQFSVDHIEASLVTNNLVSAGFNGKIVLPITKEITQEDLENVNTDALNQKALNYNAIIDPVNDNYQLKVVTEEAITFDVFKAKATLSPNSYVELNVSDGKFRPKAVLHGNLAIKASNGDSNPDKPTVDFKGIVFQNLQLQTESPYFQVSQMGYTGEVKFANFPVTIRNINFTTTRTSASLDFGIDINMMEKGFAGSTSLSILGTFNEQDGLHRWKYERIDLESIYVEADLGNIQIRGLVDIKKDDPEYGDGFYGQLGATFNGISVDASAWFGRTGFRYWYVDAYVDLSTKSVPMGPVNVNGLGGGAYYHMTKRPGAYSALVPSGQSYIPDGNAGIGFRALIGFALTNKKAFNGKVGFEMAFNRHGGLNRVLFFGEAHIIKAIDFEFGDKFKQKMTAMETKINSFGKKNDSMNNLKESNLVDYSKVAFPQDGLTFDVGIDANFAMEMDFQNHTFHAELETYVNTPGGFFQGVGPNGRAGWAVFHAGPDEWYLNVGTPNDRIGLKLGLGNFNIKSTSYLMIGDNIPGSPPPPAIVADILGVELQELSYMRDLNALGGGRGFAFGSDFSLDTGDMTFLVFYARFQAGLGFDIMVKDYGDAACKGGGQIGIDGWYANGQAYAYLQGELGINIKLFLVRKKIPIIKAGAAVLLQAKLPNPAWFKGYLGGHFNLLGGLVKGRFRFKVELGKECEIIGGSPLGGLKIISSISPNEGDKAVDVFTVPQVAFNMRINRPFELEDDEGVKTYRILMDDYIIQTEGKPIAGNLEWNENQDVANFVSHDILPPNKPISIKVAISFQERRGGSWVTMIQNGKKAVEIEERNFTTGEAPDYIPKSNIVYTYPVIDQMYFYQKERSSGYVKLHRGQPYLFAPETDWTQELRFENETNSSPTSRLTYNKRQKLVEFDLVSLTNKKEYTIRLTSKPPESGSNLAGNNENYTAQDTGYKGNTIEVRNREAETVINESTDVEVLVYDFSTSEYNTFAEKIKAKKVTKHLLEPVFSDVHALQANIKPSERFDALELNGGDYTDFKPLIQPEAILKDAYYKDAIYPLIYKGYPLKPQFTVDRDASELGLPPKKAVDVLTWYTTYLENRPSYDLLDIRMPYRYYLPYHYKQDFIDIQYKIVNAYLNNPSQYRNQIHQYNYIITGIFPAIQQGDYLVKLQYVMPGNILGSAATFKYYNPY